MINNVDNLYAYKLSNLLIFYINKNISYHDKTTSFIHIATILNWYAINDLYVTICQQSDPSKTLTILIYADGSLCMNFPNGTITGVYRTICSIPSLN